MIARLQFGTVCNLRCPYCLNHFGSLRRVFTSMTREQLRFAAKVLTLAADHLSELMVIGGEPTCLVGLDEFLGTIPPVDRVNIMTNGFDLGRLNLLVDASRRHLRTCVTISVHDVAYRDARTLLEHVDAWERMNELSGVDVDYKVLVDGVRTDTYVGMINTLVATVDAPEQRVDLSYVRGRSVRDVEALVRAKRWVNHHGDRRLRTMFDRDVVDRSYLANPFVGGVCPIVGQAINFRVDGICGVTCDDRLMPYDNVDLVVRRLVTNPRPIACTERLIGCGCDLEFNEFRHLWRDGVCGGVD